MKMTIVRKKSGGWDSKEIAEISLNIKTEVSCHIKHPQYIVLLGHKNKAELVKHTKASFSLKQVSEKESAHLPFTPHFV